MRIALAVVASLLLLPCRGRADQGVIVEGAQEVPQPRWAFDIDVEIAGDDGNAFLNDMSAAVRVRASVERRWSSAGLFAGVVIGKRSGLGLGVRFFLLEETSVIRPFLGLGVDVFGQSQQDSFPLVTLAPQVRAGLAWHPTVAVELDASVGAADYINDYGTSLVALASAGVALRF
ncbi:MAG: hypothetical protein ACJ79U_16975 [Myxococcales bacterium]